MNMTSHGIVDIKGCQHSKHILRENSLAISNNGFFHRRSF